MWGGGDEEVEEKNTMVAWPFWPFKDLSPIKTRSKKGQKDSKGHHHVLPFGETLRTTTTTITAAYIQTTHGV